MWFKSWLKNARLNLSPYTVLAGLLDTGLRREAEWEVQPTPGQCLKTSQTAGTLDPAAGKKVHLESLFLFLPRKRKNMVYWIRKRAHTK